MSDKIYLVMRDDDDDSNYPVRAFNSVEQAKIFKNKLELLVIEYKHYHGPRHLIPTGENLRLSNKVYSEAERLDQGFSSYAKYKVVEISANSLD